MPMQFIAIAIRHLIKQGASPEAIQQFVDELSVAGGGELPLTPRQARNQRYYDNKRLKASESVLIKTGDEGKEKVSHTLPKENNINNPQIASLSTPMKAKQAFKLPNDWEPSPQDLIWASQELGLGGDVVVFETEAFRDHFHSVAGARAGKRDWHRTWRNWMREAKRRMGRGRQNTTRQGFDRAFERIRNAAISQENVVDLSKIRERGQSVSGTSCDIEPGD